MTLASDDGRSAPLYAQATRALGGSGTVLPDMDPANAWLIPPASEPYVATFDEIQSSAVPARRS